MKSRILTCITAMTLFAGLASPVRLAAQHTRYKLIDLGTFGGPASTPNLLSGRGVVLGDAQLASPFPPKSNPFACPFPSGFPNVAHAFKWQNGVLKDLGTLPRGYCTVDNAINGAGEIVGASEVGEIDPIVGVRQMHAVVWIDGQIADLGTLGGYESAAGGI
jgi:probable HAF family extracellular repeat protein